MIPSLISSGRFTVLARTSMKIRNAAPVSARVAEGMVATLAESQAGSGRNRSGT